MFELIRVRVAALFVACAQRLSGIDISKIAELKKEVRKLIPSLILAAEATGEDGPKKRAIVIDGVDKWYTEVVEPINLPGPDVFIDPMLRAGVLSFANEVVDFAVELMNQYGELKKPVA
jgi:hypothetical protein